jgi:hypothetical protein
MYMFLFTFISKVIDKKKSVINNDIISNVTNFKCYKYCHCKLSHCKYYPHKYETKHEKLARG